MANQFTVLVDGQTDGVCMSFVSAHEYGAYIKSVYPTAKVVVRRSTAQEVAEYSPLPKAFVTLEGVA